jgi:dipeptidyl aminopeptidase/acylaminoacyl peptidase
VDTQGVDVVYVEWRSDHTLLVAGHRGSQSVLGIYDLRLKSFTELWSSSLISTGCRYMTVSGLGTQGDCVLIGEGYLRAPEIALIRQARYQPVRSFDVGYSDQVSAVSAVEHLSWNAPDGLEIQGWLLRPTSEGPYPLVMNIHGGPVWHWRPVWLGRGAPLALMLLKRGYAVFLPNPRGSAGRGREFARKVVGDMGGADTNDFLSGLDHLVNLGIADPQRLGVMGVSYGGFMSSWLITQDSRFAAAVPVAPFNNHVTEHLLSNIPEFVSLFLADHYINPNGRYFDRSPVMHAHKTRTPTLNVCGALDRSAPPEEAVQFHNALLENGVTSVLVTYPEEGHGIRHLPAAIDYTTRVVSWFHQHMPSDDPD